MAEYYLGQIMMTGFGYAQKTFALCNGQTLPLAQNQALFSLFGTMYGGNGSTNFLLPDLRGRVPVGCMPSADPAWQPPAYTQGAPGGVENVTLLQTQLPIHNHGVQTTNAAAAVSNPLNGLFAQTPGEKIYGPATNMVPLNPVTIGMAGGNLPHNNMQPSMVINFNVALSGVYPSRN
jgi:microcystin-dependent protein